MSIFRFCLDGFIASVMIWHVKKKLKRQQIMGTIAYFVVQELASLAHVSY